MWWEEGQYLMENLVLRRGTQNLKMLELFMCGSYPKRLSLSFHSWSWVAFVAVTPGAWSIHSLIKQIFIVCYLGSQGFCVELDRWVPAVMGRTLCGGSPAFLTLGATACPSKTFLSGLFQPNWFLLLVTTTLADPLITSTLPTFLIYSSSCSSHHTANTSKSPVLTNCKTKLYQSKPLAFTDCFQIWPFDKDTMDSKSQVFSQGETQGAFSCLCPGCSFILECSFYHCPHSKILSLKIQFKRHHHLQPLPHNFIL